MKKILLLLVTLVFAFSVQAQQTAGYTEGLLSFGNGEFFQNGMRIKMADAIRITQVNEEANELVRKARTNKVVGDIMGYSGSFAIGWGIGGAIAGAPIEWGWIGAGAGLIGLDLLFQNSFSKKAQLATEVFNANMPYGSMKTPVELAIGVQKNGFGLALNF